MEFTPKDGSYSLSSIETEEIVAITAACRESIVDIARDSADGDGDYNKSEDDPALIPLAEITHKVQACSSEVELSEIELSCLRVALERFGSLERMKEAVVEHSTTRGITHNKAIEQRVRLGSLATDLLTVIEVGEPVPSTGQN